MIVNEIEKINEIIHVVVSFFREVDLDLGNYERYLDVTLHRDNNITTGKIYQSVIDRERRGDYLGKTVQGLKRFIVWTFLRSVFNLKI